MGFRVRLLDLADAHPGVALRGPKRPVAQEPLHINKIPTAVKHVRRARPVVKESVLAIVTSGCWSYSPAFDRRRFA